MNIQPIDNSNISMHGNPNNSWNRFKHRVVQKIIDAVPECTFNESAKKLDKLNKIDNYISKPMQNRAIMGATALITQPFIDYSNPKVDKQTRRISFFNRCAVILAGTSVGMFLVRGPVYKAVEKMTNLKGDSKLSKALLPKKYLKEISENEKFLKNYRSSLAMGISLGLMLFTNFLCDAPATIFLTNLFQEYFGTPKTAKEEKNE